MRRSIQKLILLAAAAAALAGKSAFSQEPPLDYVSGLYPAKTAQGNLIGSPGSSRLFYVSPNGPVTPPGQKVTWQYAVGYPFIKPGEAGTLDRRLLEGFYPSPVIDWDLKGFEIEESTCIKLLPGGDPAALIKLSIKNGTVTKASLPLLVFLGGDEKGGLPSAPAVSYPLSWDKGRLLDKNGSLVLYAPNEPKPEYLSLFAGCGFVRTSGGPLVLNQRRLEQQGPAFTVKFEFDDKGVRVLNDSLGSSNKDQITSPGFDLLVRSDVTQDLPIAVQARLNGKDLGYIGKAGLISARPDANQLLADGASSPWVSWDSIKAAAIKGTNTLELTALSVDLEPVVSWRPIAALSAPGSPKPSDISLSGEHPEEEWARGLAYPHDTLLYQLSIAPWGTLDMQFLLPYSPLSPDKASTLSSIKWDTSVDEMKREWDQKLADSARISVPMDEVSDAYRAALFEMLLAGKSTWIEGMNRLIPALDLAGLKSEAEKRLDYLFSRQGKVGPGDASDVDSVDGFLPGEGPFCLASNGVVLWQAAEHFRLTGDRKWLEGHVQDMLDSCEWISHQRKRTKLSDGTAKIVGILPPVRLSGSNVKSYLPASSDAWNFLGLKRCALALKEIGNPEGDKLLNEAEDYRQAIIANTKALSADEIKPESFDFSHYPGRDIAIEGVNIPFLPMGPELRVPSAWGGYASNGPVNLITSGIDEPTSERAGWTMAFIEKYAMVCEKVGGIGMPLGVPLSTDNVRDPMCTSADLTHASEFALAYLGRDEIDKAVAAFVSMLAFPSWYAPGVPPAENEARFVTVLRNMLVREDGESLRICQAAPRDWFESGKRIAVEKLPASFGEVSFEMKSELVADRILFSMAPPTRKAPKETIVRFRHPKSRPIRSVELNGQPYTNFKGEDVTLSPSSQAVKLVVNY